MSSCEMFVLKVWLGTLGVGEHRVLFAARSRFTKYFMTLLLSVLARFFNV